MQYSNFVTITTFHMSHVTTLQTALYIDHNLEFPSFQTGL